MTDQEEFLVTCLCLMVCRISEFDSFDHPRSCPASSIVVNMLTSRSTATRATQHREHRHARHSRRSARRARARARASFSGPQACSEVSLGDLIQQTTTWKMGAIRVVLLLTAGAFELAAGSAVLAQQTQSVCKGDTRGDRRCNHDPTHRVCAEIGDPDTSFWRFTGQSSWCGTVGNYGGQYGSLPRCPLDTPTWCICRGVRLHHLRAALGYHS